VLAFKLYMATSWNGPDVMVVLVFPTVIGGVTGAVIGGAVWVTRTTRQVPGVFVILAWSLLGGVIGLVAASLGFCLFSGGLRLGRDSSGGGGLVILFLLIYVPALVIGLIGGAVTGAARWKRGRDKRSVAPPA
jgi:hypothetical protein